MMEYHFKPKFKERFRKLLGRELNTFLEYQKKPMKETIRINTLKISREELVKKLESRGWKLKEIPWYEDGLLVEKRKEELGNTLEYFLGYYYSQGPASMIPSLVLDPKPGEIVLDLCAAPGSKTTQMAQLMKNKGVIIANDKSLSRISILRSNLQRCGVVNTIVTRMDGRMFKNVKQEFDRVLVDAPCSSEGTMRENPHLIKEWNLYTIKKLSNLQKRLIEAGFMRLKEGGVLVYSTCTLAPEENEKVIDYLVRKWDAKIEKIKLKNVKTREGITEWKGKEFVDEIKKMLEDLPSR
jgi:NOL1/NOP2/sun family putative RNA methylase